MSVRGNQIANLRGLSDRLKAKIATGNAATLQSAKDYADAKAASLNTLEQVVLSELPAQGEAKKLYFVPSANAEQGNYYDEFVWVAANGDDPSASGYIAAHFEQVGSTAYTPTHDASFDSSTDKVVITIGGVPYQIPYIAAPATPVMKQGGNALSENAYIGNTPFTLESATSGADIYYTTDGSTPAITPSQKYNSAFTLAQGGASDESIGKSYTVKAIAVVNGVQSSVMTAHVTINRQVATPLFSPQAGSSYSSEQDVTITCATTGAAIYYTLDGSEPSENSTLYEGAIHVASQKAIRAIAILSGWASNEATSTYQFQVSTPDYRTTGDQYDTVRTLTFKKPANATSIKYRKSVVGQDFTTPTLDGNDEFTITNITETTTYEIVAERSGWKSGSISPQVIVGTLYTHAGLSTAENASEVNMNDLTIVNKAATPNGEYSFNNVGDTAKYIWIFVPSGQTIHHALNNAQQDQLATGFNSPVTYNGYKCYRAKSKTAAGGTQTLTID